MFLNDIHVIERWVHLFRIWEGNIGSILKERIHHWLPRGLNCWRIWVFDGRLVALKLERLLGTRESDSWRNTKRSLGTVMSLRHGVRMLVLVIGSKSWGRWVELHGCCHCRTSHQLFIACTSATAIPKTGTISWTNPRAARLGLWFDPPRYDCRIEEIQGGTWWLWCSIGLWNKSFFGNLGGFTA